MNKNSLQRFIERELHMKWHGIFKNSGYGPLYKPIGFKSGFRPKDLIPGGTWTEE